MPKIDIHFQRFAIGVLILFLLFCPHGMDFADTSSATLFVLVTDSSGATVGGAHLMLRDANTSQAQQGDTEKSGAATFSYLKPGRYTLTISKDGFADIVVDDILLNIGDSKRLQLSLKVGSSSQTITVDGSGLTINTSDASVSTVIDRKFVENIPLNGRSFQSLISLTPGVVTASPQSSATSGYSGEFSVNGQRTESNVYTVDGVAANTGGYIYGYGTSGTSGSLPSATAVGTTQSLVSVDALQEFRVSSSSYSAEYGGSPGGQFSFSTRSGTSIVHGTAFDYLRNNFFDANDWFNDNVGKPITALRQNDFGGTLGGPVWIPRLYDRSDRSFFFFSYEGLRLMQPQAAVINYVPSLTLRQSAPAALQPVLNAFPLPTGEPLSNGLAPFIQVASLPSDIDSTSVRFDHQITARLRAFFRFSDTQSAKESRYLSLLTNTTQSSFTNTLGLTAAISAHIANEFRLNYTSNVGESATFMDNFGGAKPIDLLQLQGINSPDGFAGVVLLFPGYSPQVYQSISTQPQHAWDTVDNLTSTRGHQTFKIGIDHREIASRLQTTTPYVYSYFNNSDAVIANSAFRAGVSVYGRSYPSYTNTGVYLQDEIRVTSRLGISAGLRWEISPPPTQTSGTLPYIVQGDPTVPSTLNLAPAGTRFWKTTYYNFAPRLGVTYEAHNAPGRETVVRVGGGVFFDTGQQISTQAFGNSPGQSASATYANAPYPLTPSQIGITISNPPVAPYATAYYFPPRVQLPYTLQWNVSLEQALGKDQAITFSYVASAGRRLQSQQLLPASTANANFSNIYVEATGTTSDYNAFQIQFQRTLRKGLQAFASYNWSHSIDYGSQNITYQQIRGDSDFDLRHNANAAISYDLQAKVSSKLLNHVVQQWGVDGRFSVRTGFPVTLEGNTITLPNGQYGYSGLNLISTAPVYLHVPGIAGNRQINPEAFSLPAPGQEGNAPRNFVRGFGENQIDLAVRRTFPIVERLSLQFRAEAFNLLNHPNFGYIVPTYGNNQFGQATQMLNQSLGGLSPLYQQGGPRSMQFALKLIF